MRVRFLTSIAGNAEPLYGLPEFSFSPGEVAEINDKLAAAWIASGIVARTAVNLQNIDASTRADILVFANETLKLNLPASTSKSQAIAAIRTAMSADAVDGSLTSPATSEKAAS